MNAGTDFKGKNSPSNEKLVTSMPEIGACHSKRDSSHAIFQAKATSSATSGGKSCKTSSDPAPTAMIKAHKRPSKASMRGLMERFHVDVVLSGNPLTSSAKTMFKNER